MTEHRRYERGDEPLTTVVVARPRWARVVSLIALGVLALIILAIAVVWTERRPIATRYLKSEFERRGVTASYQLDRVGFRTQQVSNLVIGDPRRPDLVARYAQIQMRLTWNGSFEVYRIVARGVRLRGEMVKGRVSWGQVDKLLPPPSDKPFQLPNFALDIADATIALRTPFGPLGVALQGSGQLSGGFKGCAALVSPRIAPGRCAATNLRAFVAVVVVARRPRIDGPVTLDRFNCPASGFDVIAPRFDAAASFNEAFTSVDGRGRMAIANISAGKNNGLAAFTGELTYKGSFADVAGRVKLAARQSRLGTIFADTTRLAGDYRLGTRAGTFTLVGDFAAEGAALDPSMLAGVSQPLAAAAKTPIGPVASAIGGAILRTSRNFTSTGQIQLVNFPGGGAARIDDAAISAPGGARARVFGGTGVTYYWPSGGLRIDGNIEMAGGGLPTGRVSLRQARAGGPTSGIAQIAPYTVNGTRLALTPIRFGPGPGGSTALSTSVQLDGPFPDGRVQALRLPIAGRIGRGGSFAFGTSCAVVSFDALRTGKLQLGRTRLPVCPLGPAMVSKSARGPVLASARIGATALNGSLGRSPLQLTTAGGQFIGERFDLRALSMRLGRSAAPILFDTARLGGSFAGSGISGTFADAKSTIGNVPLLLDQADGKWRVFKGDLTVDANSRVTDRSANPRFYPLRTDNLRLVLAGDYVRAKGSLQMPSGRLVTNADIEHRLSNGTGRALLDVPGLTFGPGFQPDMITRLTEGVIALVNGTVRGTGRIDWRAGGKVTSTGEFTTDNLDLAAPFGPVTGISGTMRFTDLLGLKTAPGQLLNVGSINPGILVENGTLRYQLLPGQLIRIERGEWPFMGGTLILQETVLNFARPTAKRLTFEVVGLDANTFVQNFGFKEIAASGKFDGVLPMIFDENGGRIVGGRLDARAPGGSLSYVGVVNRANLGFATKIAFDALKDLRFRTMVVRLDGDLSGEFASRITIDQLGLGGQSGVAKLVRGAFAKVPFRFNINIRGPFRALIQTAKSYKDPRQQINDVLPRPLDDIPGIVTEVRRRDEEKVQTQTPPSAPEITPTPPTER